MANNYELRITDLAWGQHTEVYATLADAKRAARYINDEYEIWHNDRGVCVCVYSTERV